ncbi:hypothetical protein [Paraburkholderia sp.]|uniref:hypothetical protein n=1 Tax=Paraburkholderia sp. TaxID=1926495 RepID=UPI0039E38130
MTLSANVQQGTWSVSVQTDAAQDGGYQATIHVRHTSPNGDFEHGFRHERVFATERDAVLEGLREGMTWIALKSTKTIAV